MIAVSQDVVAAIVRHAREAAPDECCGLLVGGTARIDEAVRTPNLRASPSAYQIDPAVHFSVLRRARAEGRQVVGAYHSHVRAPAVPSPRDLAESHDSRLVHLIVSLAGGRPQVLAYWLRPDGYDPVDLVID